ncbi:transcriptional regulator [Pseudoflavonifractor sp. An176]|nr:transcriptional regulator [Pseudoflavonifractor sp. An176]
MNYTVFHIPYSTIIQKVVETVEKEEFIKRLTQLRVQKGVSARDMSLSIGQSSGYISNIENGVNLPSMAAFFYICDYLGISPRDFFDTQTTAPSKASELLEVAKTLEPEQLDHLIALAKGLQR